MSLPVLLTGLASAVMLTLGSNMILPLSETIADVCVLGGIVCVMTFIGLVEDPGASGIPSADLGDD
jgi:hypothetical protein